MSSFTLSEIATLTDSELVGDPDKQITNVADLRSATKNDASFLAGSKFQPVRKEKEMETTQAGVVFVPTGTKLQEGKNYLLSRDSSRAFQKLLEKFREGFDNPSEFEGIHPTAVVHETAQLEEGVTLGPYAVIDARVTIGKNSFIGAHTFIGPQSSIGRDCLIHPGCTIRERCQIGNQVTLQPGVVIGSCGFGYTTSQTGKHEKLRQLGNVVLEDQVEIGANTTIDRARFKTTRIGKGTVIDNQVQIGHGVVIGENNAIAGQSGIGGSSTTGDRVILAGKIGVNNDIQITSDVIIAAFSAISKSIPNSGVYGGIPVKPLSQFHKEIIHVRNLDKYVQKLKELETQLEALQNKN